MRINTIRFCYLISLFTRSLAHSLHSVMGLNNKVQAQIIRPEIRKHWYKLTSTYISILTDISSSFLCLYQILNNDFRVFVRVCAYAFVLLISHDYSDTCLPQSAYQFVWIVICSIRLWWTNDGLEWCDHSLMLHFFLYQIVLLFFLRLLLLNWIIAIHLYAIFIVPNSRRTFQFSVESNRNDKSE